MVYYIITEIPATRDYLPDLTRLKGEVGKGKVKIVLARMPGEVLAGVLGVAVGLAPGGGHVGYVTDARKFAEYLRVLVGGEARL